MNKLNKITSGLIIISISAILVAGCQSSAAKATSAAPETVQGNRGKFDPAVMKKQYEDALKGLVTDGTIKQAQSDKVLVVLTKNMSKPKTQTQDGNNQQNGQQSGQQGTSQNKVRKNPLSELVTSKVITQAQSDAIMQKTRGNFKRPQN
ncbi:hypothetical protein [Clostridium sp. FP1]|uniref:hypothetical protein n=1 Tax=Clostridium sp. FP1 TaxID=2724076 RepID=UPI0013E9110A|nr:hypothetical protein [Clostridium sp. FP1]MBZ9634802.1 hypothetical protein [Clostridium sp. FP1]